jgi:hypothetical protein
MPLSFKIESVAHSKIRQFTDDSSEAFAAVCRRHLGDTRMLAGIIPYGDTMFNEFQLRRFLLPELEAVLAADDLSVGEVAVIEQVRDAAKEAVRARGYLYVTGD